MLQPQPTHNSGTMDVSHHVDSMTDSSDSSEDDQMLFDIMESHDDIYMKVLCLFSIFIINCFDKHEAQYEHKWSWSCPGRKKKIQCDFQGSFEKFLEAVFQRRSFNIYGGKV